MPSIPPCYVRGSLKVTFAGPRLVDPNWRAVSNLLRSISDGARCDPDRAPPKRPSMRRSPSWRRSWTISALHTSEPRPTLTACSRISSSPTGPDRRPRLPWLPPSEASSRLYSCELRGACVRGVRAARQLTRAREAQIVSRRSGRRIHSRPGTPGANARRKAARSAFCAHAPDPSN
jgi:hypothetical protein